MVRLALILLSTLFANAFVAVPERRPVTTFFASGKDAANNRLFLELGPLIGGPSWLPLHVKVILEGADETEHRWDMVPRNATEVSTLFRLLSLQSVPADIRYQTAPIRTKQRKNRIDIIPVGFDIVVDKRTSEKGDDYLADDALAEAQRAATKILIKSADKFCQSYPEEIHLFQNSCWTFAYRLYEHLCAYQLDLNKDILSLATAARESSESTKNSSAEDSSLSTTPVQEQIPRY